MSTELESTELESTESEATLPASVPSPAPGSPAPPAAQTSLGGDDDASAGSVKDQLTFPKNKKRLDTVKRRVPAERTS